MNIVRYRQTDVLLLMLSAAILMLAWPSQSVAQEQTTMSGVQLRPGVIIDRDRGLAYVMSPEGATVAVRLDDGTEAWSTMEVAKPLALVGNLLVGQAPPSGARNDLQIAAVDPDEGGRRVVADVMELPAGVQVAIDETLSSSFVADARALAGDAVVVWEFSERAMQGVPPEQEIRGMPPEEEIRGLPPEEEIRGEPTTNGGAAAELRRSSGAFLVDLPSGAMSPLRPEEVVVAPARRTSELDAAPLLPGVPEPQVLSADGRHVLSSERVADDSVWDRYLWTIYDRSTGEPVGEFRTFQSIAPFVVSDGQVIYETPPYARQVQGNVVEEPLQIRAVDLSTGQEVWSEEVRDTAYRGPFPP
jgi:hypothetical protein